MCMKRLFTLSTPFVLWRDHHKTMTPLIYSIKFHEFQLETPFSFPQGQREAYCYFSCLGCGERHTGTLKHIKLLVFSPPAPPPLIQKKGGFQSSNTLNKWTESEQQQPAPNSFISPNPIQYRTVTIMQQQPQGHRSAPLASIKERFCLGASEHPQHCGVKHERRLTQHSGQCNACNSFRLSVLATHQSSASGRRGARQPLPARRQLESEQGTPVQTWAWKGQQSSFSIQKYLRIRWELQQSSNQRHELSRTDGQDYNSSVSAACFHIIINSKSYWKASSLSKTQTSC